ncbi:hypothetical protein EVAR_36133_1 [Eumeta japonica]|uniref:Uncharacterized protein n=1 Tax=Eumeta variegata TaxID=151549 RepID=A0A4C1X1C4_EUMVA|nr:hypothetical protein EVAR_36133_1 [Eumeta japonica]
MRAEVATRPAARPAARPAGPTYSNVLSDNRDHLDSLYKLKHLKTAALCSFMRRRVDKARAGPRVYTADRPRPRTPDTHRGGAASAASH